MSDAVYLHAQQSMARGSKSFDLASRLFPPDVRRSALMLYAWCRHCDDVIDGQISGFRSPTPASDSARSRLQRLKEDTRRAFNGESMSTPAFAALQTVVVRHSIPMSLALDHLAGYEMDVVGYRYVTFEDTLLYCYRVAGVVGLMMASILDVHAPSDLDRACDLGLAFQITNIARDIVEDAAIGRCYIPQEWMLAEGLTLEDIRRGEGREKLARLAMRLVASAEPYYDSALAGLSAMPVRSAWAVGTAHGVYRAIGRKVQGQGAKAWEGRVSTSKAEKMSQLVGGAHKAARSRVAPVHQRPATLWTRPGGDGSERISAGQAAS